MICCITRSLNTQRSAPPRSIYSLSFISTHGSRGSTSRMWSKNMSAASTCSLFSSSSPIPSIIRSRLNRAPSKPPSTAPAKYLAKRACHKLRPFCNCSASCELSSRPSALSSRLRINGRTSWPGRTGISLHSSDAETLTRYFLLSKISLGNVENEGASDTKSDKSVRTKTLASYRHRGFSPTWLLTQSKPSSSNLKPSSFACTISRYILGKAAARQESAISPADRTMCASS
mmetsp:Transcript_104982/g.321636  ORF Transcript_104982/g.321636 Transcript_104982/m.321636 type:complete len:231 (+) Transcript_104982:1082-1774(+)